MSSKICNFAHDSTIYARGNDIHEILMVLEYDLCRFLEWFICSGMVVNRDKSQLTFLKLKRQQELRININGVKMLAKKHVKLLGVETGSGLKFGRHLDVEYNLYHLGEAFFAIPSMIAEKRPTLARFEKKIKALGRQAVLVQNFPVI